MYNLLPGQGLGSQARKELAFGLGCPFIEAPAPVEDVQTYGGGGEYVSRYDWDDILSDRRRREQIITEDEEILQIIIEALTSGIFE